MHVGERIRLVRNSLGLTVEETSVKIKRGSTTIWHWERGNTSPRFDDLVALADAFGVDLSRLVEGVGDKPRRSRRRRRGAGPAA